MAVLKNNVLWFKNDKDLLYWPSDIGWTYCLVNNHLL
jgi:hypothetical protein